MAARLVFSATKAFLTIAAFTSAFTSLTAVVTKPPNVDFTIVL